MRSVDHVQYEKGEEQAGNGQDTSHGDALSNRCRFAERTRYDEEAIQREKHYAGRRRSQETAGEQADPEHCLG